MVLVSRSIFNAHSPSLSLFPTHLFSLRLLLENGKRQIDGQDARWAYLLHPSTSIPAMPKKERMRGSANCVWAEWLIETLERGLPAISLYEIEEPSDQCVELRKEARVISLCQGGRDQSLRHPPLCQENMYALQHMQRHQQNVLTQKRPYLSWLV